MAFGPPILPTRWRSIPELLPPGYSCLVDICSPGQVANALVTALTDETAESFREIFLRSFSLEQYLDDLARAFHDVESANHGAQAPARPLAMSPSTPASHPP